MEDDHIYFWNDESDNKGATPETSREKLQSEQAPNTNQ